MAAPLIDPKLKALGFEEPTAPVARPRVLISSVSKEKKGKTSWAFTMPEPIAILSNDNRTRDIADQFVGKVKFVLRQIDLPRMKGTDMGRNKTAVKDNMEAYGPVWDNWVDCHYAILEQARAGKFRTVVWDTATDAWETCRVANFGRYSNKQQMFTELNSEFKRLIRDAKAVNGLNALFIHKVGKEYKQAAGKDEANWTGRWEFRGFGDMPYLVDVSMEHYITQAVPEEDKAAEFGIRVLDSGINLLNVVGEELTGDMNSFDGLVSLLYPDVEAGYWRRNGNAG